MCLSRATVAETWREGIFSSFESVCPQDQLGSWPLWEQGTYSSGGRASRVWLGKPGWVWLRLLLFSMPQAKSMPFSKHFIVRLFASCLKTHKTPVLSELFLWLASVSGCQICTFRYSYNCESFRFYKNMKYWLNWILLRFTHACVHMCVHSYVCRHTTVEVCCLQVLPASSLSQGFSLAWNVSNRLNVLACEPQESTCLCPPYFDCKHIWEGLGEEK